MWPRVRDQKLFLTLITGLIGLAWLSLVIWKESPYGRFLSHGGEGDTAVPAQGYFCVINGGLHDRRAALVLLFVAGWMLMTVAMMLPTSLPLIAFFQALVRRGPHHVRLVVILIVGYLAVWSAFAVVAHVGDLGIHAALARTSGLPGHAWAIGAGIFIVAGLYQFSPFKYRCLDKCRSPVSFVMGHWHGGRHGAEAFRLGMHHGLFCLGCCWSLMLLMFAVGVGSIGWMLALGAVMAVEKNVSWGRRLSAPLGVALIVVGLVLSLTQTSLGGAL
jgi:predicted metal-binding membrane protein